MYPKLKYWFIFCEQKYYLFSWKLSTFLSLRKSDVTEKYDEYQHIALVQQNIELPNHVHGKVNIHSHIYIHIDTNFTKPISHELLDTFVEVIAKK